MGPFTALSLLFVLGIANAHPTSKEKLDVTVPKEVVEYFTSRGNPPNMTASAFKSLQTQLGLSEDGLLLAIADYAMNYAVHVPVSHFQVGACTLGSNGDVFLGANFEIEGEPLFFGIHGEQSATHHALLMGQDVKKLAVNAAPCGYCRQFLSEIRASDQFVVTVHKPTLPKSYTNILSMPLTSEKHETCWLPYSFGPQDLGQTIGMATSPGWTIDYPGTNDPLIKETVKYAAESYAPYSLIPAAMGLQFGSVTKVGKYLENAAYNPSLSPTIAAVSISSLNHMDFKDLTRAVLVQAVCCSKSRNPDMKPDFPSVDHSHEARLILKSLNPHIELEVVYVNATQKPLR